MGLIVLAEDGPLGKAGTQVWVDDPEEAKPDGETRERPGKHPSPRKHQS